MIKPDSSAGKSIKGYFFRQILSYQPVGVFVEPPFPSVIGMGEIDVQRKSLRQRLVGRELLAVVQRQGVSYR
jgi:hypothetical protein